MTLVSFFPGALGFTYGDSEKMIKSKRAWNQFGFPLKIFNSKMTFLPMATLKDLAILERQKGMFVGATNILISQTPVIKSDLVINLDDNFFDYRPTELGKIAKTSTMTDKKFITSLIKDLGDMDHQVPKKDQFSWDSIPMEDG